ncbi:MAG: Chitinase (EC [uncultured Sulfurovum sp.]|uniref:Chitinase (EC) n=1 Tax=uncultured Sulfurovum sp. TaxID=269237 RepID=A0A6S6SNZ6_9BACT|nr:MAG: Chitinase (EC [uncultured Sulfurovum sp.]
MIIKNFSYVFMLVLLFLTGCGNEVTSGKYTETAKQGYVIDAPVVNLTYQCGDKTSKTTTGGLFICPTLPVTFSVGGLTLGTLTSINDDTKVYVQDIVKLNRDNFSSEEVIKLGLFLQSLDKDKNNTEQIVIDDTINFESTKDFSEMNLSEVQVLLRTESITPVTLEAVEEHLRRFSELDTLAPIITLNGESNISIHEGITYNDLGAIAKDDRDENVHVQTKGEVDTSTVGIYRIEYTATDSAGNVGTATRVIHVIDTSVPLLTLLGTKFVSVAQNGVYKELGATAIDTEDGNISDNILITGYVNTKVLGTYIITYHVVDKAGNAVEVERTVNVVDMTAPTLVISDNKNGVLETSFNPTTKSWVAQSVLFTFSFSEPVTGFTMNDVLVKNGIKGAFSGSNNRYTLEVFPLSHSILPIAVTVPAGVVNDIANNANLVATDASQPTNTQVPFITRWKTDNYGISEDNQISIVTNRAASNHYSIDWGDGQIEHNITGDINHTYENSGEYSVSITGDFSGTNFYNNEGGSYDAQKLVSIEQWGTMPWEDMNNMFYACSNLVGEIKDIPNLKNTINMSFMFENSSFNQDINDWNVSNVQNMRGMFATSVFNQLLNKWDVSSVTDMKYMFYEAHAFNQPLDTWDVSSVINMGLMFYDANTFNQSLNSWNVSSVTDMYGMFYNVNTFNQPLDNWDVSSVTNMAYMFYNTRSFNQNLNSWDVSSVRSMYNMFNFAVTFNQTLNNWNVSSVTNMSSMFSNAILFNQPLNDWNVSNVTDMSYMFSFMKDFNQDIGSWDVSKVLDMSSMFNSSKSFNQDISAWNVSSVLTMKAMFYEANTFNQNINRWDVSNVTDMSKMFEFSTNFNQPLNDWNVSNVTDMSYMFSCAYAFNQPLHNWDVSSVMNMNWTFNNTPFNQDINGWNVSSVESMYRMFSLAKDFNQPLNDWDVSSVTDMDGMFYNAHSFNQPLSHWNVSNVSYMVWMFYNAYSFSQSLTDWDISNVHYYDDFSYNSGLDIDDLPFDYIEVLISDNKEEALGVSFDDVSKQWLADPIIFTFVLSEPSTEFDVSDIQVENGIKGTFSGSEDTYTLEVLAELNSIEPMRVRMKDNNFFAKEAVQEMNTQEAFITTWKTDNPGMSEDNEISINTSFLSSNHYSIDWGDGQIEHNITGDINHTYENSGEYNISITGDFSGTFFYNPEGDSYDAQKLLSIKQWGTIPWKDMSAMFYGCTNLIVDSRDNPNLTKTTNMSFMFEESSFNQNINDWNVSNVQGMYRMFFNASSFNQPLNDWNVSSVTDMELMFSNASAFNQDLSSWDVSSVSYMNSMFEGAESFTNQDLSTWNVVNVLNYDDFSTNWGIDNIEPVWP